MFKNHDSIFKKTIKRAIDYFSIPILICSSISIVSCDNSFSVSSDHYDVPLPEGVEIDHPRSTEFQNFLTKKAKEGLPGATMLIRSPEGLWIGAAGKCDIENNIAMKPGMIGFIGSVAKPFTATAVLRLAENGELNIDDKISKYLSSEIINNIDNAKSMTIRHLLQHTSGVCSGQSNSNVALEQLFDHPEKKYSALDYVKVGFGEKGLFKPGTSWSYADMNYAILALVIEGATQRDHWTVIKELVFDPLELTNTHYNPSIPIPQNVIRGYADIHSNGVLTDVSLSMHDKTTPAGGIISNVFEMGKFIKNLIEGELLSPNSLDEMQDWYEREDSRFAYGLGLEYEDYSTEYDSYSVGHGGELVGAFACVKYFPNEKITFAFIVNGWMGTIKTIKRELEKEAVEMIFNGK